jgi:hypothetical protein
MIGAMLPFPLTQSTEVATVHARIAPRFVRLDKGPQHVALPVELSGDSAWPVPRIVMSPTCAKCHNAAEPEEEMNLG